MTTNSNGRLSLSWFPILLPLTVDGFAGFRVLRDVTRLNSFEVGVRARGMLSYGQMDIMPTLEYTVTTWGEQIGPVIEFPS